MHDGLYNFVTENNLSLRQLYRAHHTAKCGVFRLMSNHLLFYFCRDSAQRCRTAGVMYRVLSGCFEGDIFMNKTCLPTGILA